MVGTPAFCSPEQLRGEELNARSDMYAVGVTLFYLITGRVPFEGQNIAQSTANTLEKSPPAPRKSPPEKFQRALKRSILRCLKKQATDRFKNYAELRQAIAPYSSTAPTPATLGLRCLAGILDQIILSTASFSLILLTLGNPFGLLDSAGRQPLRWTALMLTGCVVGIFYYAISEGFWGATPGKAICRLRVVRPDKNPPGFLRAVLRALAYTVLPILPFWLVNGPDPFAYLRNASAPQIGAYLLQGFGTTWCSQYCSAPSGGETALRPFTI